MSERQDLVKIGDRNFEVLSDGRTVWVNAPNCIARMSRQLAEVAGSDDPTDVYREWVDDGALPQLAWLTFKARIKLVYGLEIDDRHRPDGLLSEVPA